MKERFFVCVIAGLSHSRCLVWARSHSARCAMPSFTAGLFSVAYFLITGLFGGGESSVSLKEEYFPV